MARLDFLGSLDSSRLHRLLWQAIDLLELNLTGARVLTEAASREYAVTPILAAAAGAEVCALTRDSPYASVAEVLRQVTSIASVVGVSMDSIRVLSDRASLPARFDVITNLGFVRPVDAAVLERLSPTGVVYYMCES